MSVSVGGVNVSLGLDGTQLNAGIEAASKRIQNFMNEMNKIRLQGLVKGDPFADTKKHITETRAQLQSIFSEWVGLIGDVDKSTNRFASASARNLDKVNKAWQKTLTVMKGGGNVIRDLQDTFSERKFRDLQDERQKKLGGKKSAYLQIGDMLGDEGSKAKLLGELAEAGINAPGKAKVEIRTLVDKINRNIKIRISDIKKIQDSLDRVQQEAMNVMGASLQKGFKAQTRLEGAYKLGVSPMQADLFGGATGIPLTGEQKAMGARRKEVLELREAIKRHTAEVKINKDTIANRDAILQKSLRLRQLGAKLTDEESAAIARNNKASMLQARMAEKINRIRQRREDIVAANERTGATAQQRAVGMFGQATTTDEQKARRERIQEILKLRDANSKHTSEIRINRDAIKNRDAILQNSLRLRELGAKLTKEEARTIGMNTVKILKEAKAQRVLNEERAANIRTGITSQQRLAGMHLGYGTTAIPNYSRIGPGGVGQKVTGLKTDITEQNIHNRALAERGKLIWDLRKANLSLMSSIKAGINVDENRKRLIENINRLMKVGVKTIHLTARENAALAVSAGVAGRGIRGLGEEIKKVAKESMNVGKGGFLSKEWLGRRLVWFAQLRLAWGMWRGMQDVLRSVTDLEVELSRAMRTANSILKSHVDIYKEYKQALITTRVAFGATWGEGGEVLYQLASAGLTSEQALAGLSSTMATIVGLEGDVRETTKAVAGIYNVFGDTLKGVNTEEEKLTQINDLISAAWRRHQVEVSELTDGLKMSANMAKVSGMEITDLVAILSVANDNMIKGGRAGRALTNVFSRVARSSKEFKDAFGLSFDETKPLKFMEIMEELGTQFKNKTLSVDELGIAFERMGLRGAPIFATLLQNWDEVKVAVQEFSKVHGESMELANIRMDNFVGQFKRFVGGLSPVIARMETMLKPLTVAFKFYADILKKINEEELENIIASTNAKSFVGFGDPYLKVFSSYISIKGFEKLEKDLKRLVEYKKKLDKKGYEFIPQAKEVEEQIDALTKLIKFRKQATDQEIKEADIREASQEKITSAAEKEWTWRYKNRGELERIKILQRDIAVQEKLIQTKREDAARIEGYTGRQAKWTEILTEEEKLTKMKSDLESVMNELIYKPAEKSRKAQESALGFAKQAKEFGIKRDEAERDSLKKNYIIGDEKKRIDELNESILQKEMRIADINRKLVDLGMERNSEDLVLRNYLADQSTELEKQASIEKKKAADLATEIAANDQLKREITYEAQKAILVKTKEIELGKINHRDVNDIFGLELDILGINERKLIQHKKLTKDTYEQLSIDERIKQIAIDRLNIEEKIKRNRYPLYGAMQDIKDSAETWKQFQRSMLVSGHGIAVSGLTGIGVNITGGFQEQRQAAAELRAELERLSIEYDGLIEAGDVEKAKEITQQMATLRDELKSMEDPVRNLGEAFRVFFKDFVDQLREATIRWLVFKAMTGIMSKFATPTGTSANQYMGIGGMATGGILPQIKSFKTFSSGGMTGRPMLAMLGDNKSHRELIIPEENIKSNNVSGYMRDGDTPINIVNVFTEDDILGVVGGVKGTRTVVNMIGADLRKGGKTSKSMRV